MFQTLFVGALLLFSFLTYGKPGTDTACQPITGSGQAVVNQTMDGDRDYPPPPPPPPPKS